MVVNFKPGTVYMRINPFFSWIISFLLIIVFVFACSTLASKKKKSQIMETKEYKIGTFGYDLKFLEKYINPVVLRDKSGNAMLIASSEWQGRIITSTAGGIEGTSYGWINYKLLESGELQEHMNAFGGEDRAWLGPEGGQFSFYFKQGSSFDFENWFVPKEIDTEPFNLIRSGDDYAQFGKEMQLKNYSGNSFNIKLTRNVRLLTKEKLDDLLGINPGNDINLIGFESETKLTNTGNEAWSKETGMPSIWILGMFTPSPGVTIVIPYKQGDESLYGPIVNDTYFGTIPSDRLKIKNGIILFRGDGKARGKIGLSPLRVVPVAGSYDAIIKTLTIVRFSFTEGLYDYVNSMWEIQKEPFKGDVLNSYNDGPLADGSQMGPFYELESSSPAANLQPGESLTHVHQTFHFQGNEEELNAITLKVFGISLDEIKSAF
jgi:hypothetical protein